MSARALAAALRALGVECDVEGRDRLAVIRAHDGAEALANPEVRERALALLAAHGYTHLALELTDSADGAALPGD
ncbi:MAG TPA: hypothetical protein VNA89_10700 [Gemmatimonadaceae bacterium]|nr:hypothetical protein [Gemmatimonadaceae bacterium]